MPRTCHRCSECRRTFTPSVRAISSQKVCSAECRHRRDRKLARRRRIEELEAHREDERVRQRAHRAKRRGGAECAHGHAPASGRKQLDLQAKVVIFVDRALARSRASLLRDLPEILLRESESLANTG